MGLLEPTATERGWYGLGVAGSVMAGLLAAGRIGRPIVSQAAAVTVAIAGLALALVAGGAADELLRPDRWDELAAGIERGIGALPGARVPYRGLDEWTRLVIGVGGTAGMALAAALAFWPRPGRAPGHLGAAAVTLVVLYAVPAVALDTEGQFLRGALLALLVLGFLTLERLRVVEVRAAAGLAAVAALGALAAGPLLDSDQPWFDYEHWALSAASSRSTTYNWEHDYGPLDWPRDGREILRVKTEQGAYWKADALDGFDGLRWVRRALAINDAPTAQIPHDAARLERWTQRLHVSVRNLRSRTFVTAGIPIDIRMPPRFAVPTGVAGIHASSRSLRRGDVYDATVYTPRPTARELREAGSDFGFSLRPYMAFTAIVPEARGDRTSVPAYEIQPAPFASDERHGVVFEVAAAHPPAYRAENLLRRSTLRRTWRLAQRLRAEARTPYEVVQRVQSYLGSGRFAYTEAPQPAAQTLEGFLFEARGGFCQQYSGAMALLLRMAGIPARVATGFTPGAFDAESGEFVVRDFDAHSWVEVGFPGIGWVPFDPTPAASPARRQAGIEQPGGAGVGDVEDLAPGDRPPAFASGRGTADAAGERSLAGPIAGGVAAALALAGAAWLGVRRRRRGPRTALDDLERAMRRTRRPLLPQTTLRALEGSLAGSPGAAYVRALREQRFAGGHGPSRSERRALRSALGRGGLAGRLRSWWALPPRWR